MDPRDIAFQRLHNLGLDTPRFASPEEAVGWLVAVQSQDVGPALWSVGQRVTGATEADVGRAYDEGRLLRTHVLRPTWHFVRPDDIRMLLAATGPRVQRTNGSMYRQLSLDEATRQRAAGLVGDALAGGQHRTRDDLRAVLEAAGIATDGFRMAYLLMNAELEGLLCSGARQGSDHTHALLDERVGAGGRPWPDREEAIAELVVRHVTSHGPTTRKDVQAWSSLTLTEIDRAVADVGDRLTSTEDGQVTWWSAGPPLDTAVVTAARAATPSAHLLQSYDEYGMGYRPTRGVIDVAGVATGQPPFNGLVVLDGQLAGWWKRTIRARQVTIDFAPEVSLSERAVAAVQAAAERHACFLDGRTVEVVVHAERHM